MHKAISRRNAIKLGGLFGLSLPELLRRQATAAQGGSFGRARRMIMLYLHGGHPQQETFDPKPDGPSAVKGEFGAISTSLPGIQFSELLPQCAPLAHRMAIIRSMSHEPEPCDSQPASEHRAQTSAGNSTDGLSAVSERFPAFGAVVDAVRPANNQLPGWVRIAADAAAMGRRCTASCRDSRSETRTLSRRSEAAQRRRHIEAVQPADALTSTRIGHRQSLLRQIDEQRRMLDDPQ